MANEEQKPNEQQEESARETAAKDDDAKSEKEEKKEDTGADAQPAADAPPRDSTLPLDPKIAGVLCYVLGFISGIAFLILEKKNQTVRFHAMQSTITFGLLFLAQLVVGWDLITWLLQMVIGLAALAAWIFLMFKAFQGERFKLPILGGIAEERLKTGNAKDSS